MKIKYFENADVKSLNAFELKYNIKLPSDYREFILKKNGGIFEQEQNLLKASSIKQLLVLNFLLGLNTCEKEFDLVLMNDPQDLPFRAINIGFDAFGNEIVLISDGANDGIYLSDHDCRMSSSKADQLNLYLISKTFQEFLSRVGNLSMLESFTLSDVSDEKRTKLIEVPKERETLLLSELDIISNGKGNDKSVKKYINSTRNTLPDTYIDFILNYNGGKWISQNNSFQINTGEIFRVDEFFGTELEECKDITYLTEKLTGELIFDCTVIASCKPFGYVVLMHDKKQKIDNVFFLDNEKKLEKSKNGSPTVTLKKPFLKFIEQLQTC